MIITLPLRLLPGLVPEFLVLSSHLLVGLPQILILPLEPRNLLALLLRLRLLLQLFVLFLKFCYLLRLPQDLASGPRLVIPQ